MLFCVCGNTLDKTGQQSFKVTRRPCLCKKPARPAKKPLGTLGCIVRGSHPRDPKRAALGLPDRTPYERAVLKGTFSE